ncbi:IS1634 family transposase [Solwaraspora sp. WMMD792]|uniref:IS1634 family transposase n=1 Tax=Solwaraspora sp. WMMD792 TaxID=3016099 RepID=UPI0024172592|nr:IS1634 family transposase [Solwaraspora sp. WMMD792]MDG4769736.1 IS1634 family transposase [Solwaraspora sp. WMMD792]
MQIVHSSRRGSRDIEHIGSAHDETQLAVLKSVARQRLAAGQGELDLGLDDSSDAGGPLEITSSRMGHLWDALCRGYDQLGFAEATGGDEVFRQLVLARIIEPTSKQDSLRVLDEVGVDAVSYPTVNRRLPQYAKAGWRQRLSAACAAHARLGPASLVLYDVSTLYFETDTGDGFRESGFSKERRLEPQITIGLLTDAGGFPLMVEAFEGNKAETLTMVPTIRSFMDAHRLPDVTVVADAGMISAANQRAIEDAGLSFILGARIAEVPYVVSEWRREHPGQEIGDGHVFCQPWPAGPGDRRRDQVIYYQYKADRARRTLRGIDEQVAKAVKAVAGKAPVKRNRFIHLAGETRTVNRTLEAKARALAGLKGYATNLTTSPDGAPVTAGFVIDAYHRLFQIEKSFRMSKHDLAARPIYHHKRESIEAHLTIVFAALAVARWIEDRTGWSIRKFVRTARRYRTIRIQAGDHTLTAADPLPDDLRHALKTIHAHPGAH